LGGGLSVLAEDAEIREVTAAIPLSILRFSAILGMEMSNNRCSIFRAVFLAAALLAMPAHGADSLLWNTKSNTVTADIKNWDLSKVLGKISALTGWKVIIEPGTTGTITAKFKNASADEALNRLLPNINFAKDATNGVSRLLVFRTVARAATEIIEPAPPDAPRDFRIPNELLVHLKRGATNSIDDVAASVGAKIIGRDDRLKLYRFQFADADAADAASVRLAADNSVGSVDSNYIVDRPAPVQTTPVAAAAGGTSGAGLQTPVLNAKSPVNGIVIGLVDTAVQMQQGFNQYSLPPLTVVGQPNESADQPAHGTMMFEDLLQGMASDPSKILPVDVYPANDSTTTYQVVQGIVAAINSGANIINLSLGGTGDSATLQSLIEQGTQKGVLFVAAAGNTPGTAPTYPAAYPGVLAVTASDPNGQLASYADDGSFVKAMEPGTSVVYLNGQAWEIQGTSTATAFATAAIAQIVNQQHVSIQQAVTQFIQAHPAPKP
jgi:hypothetical protein